MFPKSPVLDATMSYPASDSLEQPELLQSKEYTLGLYLSNKSIGWAVLHGDWMMQSGVSLFENAKEISNNKLRSVGKLRVGRSRLGML